MTVLLKKPTHGEGDGEERLCDGCGPEASVLPWIHRQHGGGGGSEDRYLARLFGLYYTDNSRISVFGNMNNMNETRRPGSQGDWSPSNSPQGQKTTRQVGVDFNTSSKSQKILERGNVTFAWDNTHDLTHSSQENFASTGNIYSRSINDSRSDNHSFNLYNNFQVSGKLGVWLDTRIDYSDRKSSSSNLSATYSANPERWGDIRQTIDSTFAQNVSGSLHDIITNRSLYQSRSKYMHSQVVSKLWRGISCHGVTE